MTYLKHGKFMINKNSEASHRNNQEFHSESVMVAVVRCPELLVHKNQRGIRRQNEDDFHHRVVDRHEYREQVEVTC